MELSNNTLHIGPSSYVNRITEIAAMLPRFQDYEIRGDFPVEFITRNDTGAEIHVPYDWGRDLWEIFLWDEEKPANLDLVLMLISKLVRDFDENEVMHRLRELAREVEYAFDNAWHHWAENDRSDLGLDRLAWAARRLMIRKIEKEPWIENLVHDHSYHLQFAEMELYSEIWDE